MYKLIRHDITGQDCGAVRDNGDGTFTSFMFDPANTDYQQYLAWLAEGNVPEEPQE